MVERCFIDSVRCDFPIFKNVDNFIYFDNAATTQKPKAVVDRINHFYCYENANIHRGLYPLSRKTNYVFDQARETIQKWIDAAGSEEIVFTKSSTEAINLVSNAFFEKYMKCSDNMIITELEHSSNYFPWIQQCKRIGCDCKIAKAASNGTLAIEDILNLTDTSTKLITVTGMSNVTGFMPNIKELIRLAHEKGIKVFVDATQLIAHNSVSVRQLDCDFMCFSGHKIYGPMGIGVLYGKRELLWDLPPFLYGGDMVVKGDGNIISYREDPGKYEAGTQNIAGVLGLEAAIKYLERRKFKTELLDYENELSQYMYKRLSELSFIEVDNIKCSSTIFSFSMKNCGSYDVGIYLASKGICIRTGAHCAYPLMNRMGYEDTARISLSFYNTYQEVDFLIQNLCEFSERISYRK